MIEATFSAPPDAVLATALSNGFQGLHFEQGVPLLDRDLNLLHDLQDHRMRRHVEDYWGSGVVAASSFEVHPLAVDGTLPASRPGDFGIAAGTAVVNGMEVVAEKSFRYSDQPGDSGCPPLVEDRRLDGGEWAVTAYLDVWQTEITRSSNECDLDNVQDVGVRTTTRLQTQWSVRLADGEDLPVPSPGHGHMALATLTMRNGQSRLEAEDIRDRRPRQRRMPSVVAFVEEATSRAEEALAIGRELLRPVARAVAPTVTVERGELTVIGDNLGSAVKGVVFEPANDGDRRPAVFARAFKTIDPGGSLTVEVPVGAPSPSVLRLFTEHGETRTESVRVLHLEHLPHDEHDGEYYYSNYATALDGGGGLRFAGVRCSQPWDTYAGWDREATIWMRSEGEWLATRVQGEVWCSIPPGSYVYGVTTVRGMEGRRAVGCVRNDYEYVGSEKVHPCDWILGGAGPLRAHMLGDRDDATHAIATAIDSAGSVIVGRRGEEGVGWECNSGHKRFSLGAVWPRSVNRQRDIGGMNDEQVPEIWVAGAAEDADVSEVEPLSGNAFLHHGRVEQVSDSRRACGGCHPGADVDADSRAFVWYRGVTTLLQDGGRPAVAYGVNESGTVVGCMMTNPEGDPSVWRAVLWPSAEDPPVDLGLDICVAGRRPTLDPLSRNDRRAPTMDLAGTPPIFIDRAGRVLLAQVRTASSPAYGGLGLLMDSCLPDSSDPLV